MKSSSLAPLLAALAVTALSGASLPATAAEAVISAEALPSQPLTPPVDDSQLRAPADNTGTPRRVVAPPKPAGQTQVIPGLTYLHKESSTEATLRARERAPATAPTLPDGSPSILPDDGTNNSVPDAAR